MKKFVTLLLGLVIALLLNGSNVQARTIPEIKVQHVSSLENTPYSETTDIAVYGEYDQITTKVEITTSGVLRVNLRVGSPTFSTTTKSGQGLLWLSKSERGDDVIGQTYTITSTTKLDHYLDAGTYYVQLKWSCDRYDLGVALLFESSGETATIQQSTFDCPDRLTLGKEVRGFVSLTSPNDYYRFKLEKEALVTFNVAFLGSKSSTGSIRLYNTNQKEILFNQSSRSVSGEVTAIRFLEPGTYCVCLAGHLGSTTLVVKPTYYKIELEPETLDWVSGRLRIDMTTSIEYKNIAVVSGTVTKDNAATMVAWDSDPTATVVRKGNSFEVSKNGKYTVRLTDQIGQYVLKTIEIDNIDNTAPKVKGITDGKLYRTARTLRWSDKDSGTAYAKLNGKKIKSGYKVTKDGNYSLTVEDKVGNVITLSFTVDTKGPKFYGLKKTKVQKPGFVLTTKDSGSGVEYCEVNGQKYLASYGQSTLTFNQIGKYTVVAYDKAGNKSTVKLKIKQ